MNGFERKVFGLYVVLMVALMLILVGVAACTHITPKPKPTPTPVVSCVGDHDNDCPASEPDNDGH